MACLQIEDVTRMKCALLPVKLTLFPFVILSITITKIGPVRYVPISAGNWINVYKMHTAKYYTFHETHVSNNKGITLEMLHA